MNSEIAKSRIGEVIRIDTVTSTQADFWLHMFRCRISI